MNSKLPYYDDVIFCNDICQFGCQMFHGVLNNPTPSSKVIFYAGIVKESVQQSLKRDLQCQNFITNSQNYFLFSPANSIDLVKSDF